MHLYQILDAIYPLPEKAKQKLRDSVAEVHFPRGHILLRANKIEPDIYFIKKGIMRAYKNAAGNEITFWFGQEGDPVISMKSYVQNEKGYEQIELLEHTELYHIKSATLQSLYTEDLHIANWGRKLAERELVKTEERLISRQFSTALERYKELIQNQPGLIRRVQLGYIASYLGISQVSLSRIRAEIR